MPDLYAARAGVLAVLVCVIVWLGLYPQPVLDTAGHALTTCSSMRPARRTSRHGDGWCRAARRRSQLAQGGGADDA